MRRVFILASVLLLPITAAHADGIHLSTLKFFESVGADKTSFCALEARQDAMGVLQRAVDIKSFDGKPLLSVDFVDTSWTMPAKGQYIVRFGSNTLRPLTLEAMSFPNVLDLALPGNDTPSLLAAIDTPSLLQIDFPGLESPPWLIAASYNSVEIHKFIRCRNRQPRGRGL